MMIKCKLIKSAKNVPGVEIMIVDKLNAKVLAPGNKPGRLTLYSTSAIKRLGEEKLFTEEYVHEKKQENKTQPEKVIKNKTPKKKELVKVTKKKNQTIKKLAYDLIDSVHFFIRIF